MLCEGLEHWVFWRWNVCKKKKIFEIRFLFCFVWHLLKVTEVWMEKGMQEFIFIFVFQVLSPFFKASTLWADAFYKSKCPSVRPCVCSLLRYRLNVFLPPFPEVVYPIFLEIRNPWGKVMERSGLKFEIFCLKIVKNRAQKKVFFLLILPYKTWWKPRFSMD